MSPFALGNSQTQPDAFALRVYFNVQQSKSADKQKPSNSLVPIDIEYNGDLVGLPLDNEAVCELISSPLHTLSFLSDHHAPHHF